MARRNNPLFTLKCGHTRNGLSETRASTTLFQRRESLAAIRIVLRAESGWRYRHLPNFGTILSYRPIGREFPGASGVKQ